MNPHARCASTTKDENIDLCKLHQHVPFESGSGGSVSPCLLLESSRFRCAKFEELVPQCGTQTASNFTLRFNKNSVPKASKRFQPEPPEAVFSIQAGFEATSGLKDEGKALLQSTSEQFRKERWGAGRVKIPCCLRRMRRVHGI